MICFKCTLINQLITKKNYNYKEINHLKRKRAENINSQACPYRVK